MKRRPLFKRAQLWEWSGSGPVAVPDDRAQTPRAPGHPEQLHQIEETPSPVPESSRAAYLALVRAAAGSAAAMRLAEVGQAAPRPPSSEPGSPSPRMRRRRLSVAPPQAGYARSRIDEFSASSGSESEEPEPAEEALSRPDARAEFFARFHKDSDRRPRSARSAYLQSCEESQLAPLPVLELRRRHSRPRTSAPHAEGQGQGQGVRCNLDHYFLGAKRGLAVASALGRSGAMGISSMSLVGAGLTERTAAAMVRALAGRGVTRLDLSENSVGRAGCEALAALVAGERQLVSLRVARNGLGDRAAAPLLAAVPGSGLKELGLSGNDGLCGGLAPALQPPAAVAACGLAWSRCTPAVGAALGAPGSAVADLDLSHASVGSREDTVAALVAGVAASTALTRLDLSHNALGERAAFALATALPAQLLQLKLENNPLGPSAARGLVALLLERAALDLRLAACTFDAGEQAAVDVHDCDGPLALRMEHWYERAVAEGLRARVRAGRAAVAGLPAGDADLPERGELHLTVAACAAPGPPPTMRAEALPGVLRTAAALGTHPRRALAVALAREAVVGGAGWRALLAQSARDDGRLDAVRTAAAVAVALGERRDELLRQDVQGRMHVEGLGVLAPREGGELQQGVGQWAAFTPANATGHYSLTLSDPVDRDILRTLGFHGAACFRNVRWVGVRGGESLVPPPSTGRVEFDFAPAALGGGVSASASASEDDVAAILSRAGTTQRMLALREAAQRLFFSGEQALRLLALFAGAGGGSGGGLRAAVINAYVLLHARVPGGIPLAPMLRPVERVTLRHHLGPSVSLSGEDEGVEVVEVSWG